jgi:hypothetical protein
LREIIRSNDIADAVNGVEFASFSCLSSITLTGNGEDNRKGIRNTAAAELRAESECLPPEWLLPGNPEIPFKPLLPFCAEKGGGGGISGESSFSANNQICALKQISFSPFNPPPGPRRMKVLFLT